MSIFNYRESSGYFSRLKEALQATSKDLDGRLREVMGASPSPVSEEQLEDLEGLLIGADLGFKTTHQIIEKVKNESARRSVLTLQALRRMIRSEILGILSAAQDRRTEEAVNEVPRVVFVVGVNGVGKTTTLGKLAFQLKEAGRRVLMCASDTFRAAAIDQLVIWAERTGVDIVKQQSGSDPAAVLFDAMAAAKARGSDVLLVDTAGRLHTKDNLMQEVEKMKRVAAREVAGAPHEIYLVLDATTGQNGLNQAREFLNRVGLTGVVITKLDGTAKGGIVITIARELGVPILFVGTGEGKEDLIPFSPEAFVDSLLGETEGLEPTAGGGAAAG